MVIKFNPAFSPAAVQPPAGMQKSPSALSMAPVGLTPLAPPSPNAPAANPAAQPDPRLAAERRQAFFAARQRLLLDRVGQPASSPEDGRGSMLAPVQRAACEQVLKLVAARVLAQQAG